MPRIIPIRDLRNTGEISRLAHAEQEPIFVTKNGYSDLVVMSAELYDRFASVLKIDQAIFEAEEEMSKVAESMDVEEAFAALDKKYYE